MSICWFYYVSLSNVKLGRSQNLYSYMVSTYRICSRNLRTFFFILAAENSGCVKYADFYCGGLDVGFILV